MVYFYWTVSLQKNQVKSWPCHCPPPQPTSTRKSYQRISLTPVSSTEKNPVISGLLEFWKWQQIKESICGILLRLISAWISCMCLTGPPSLNVQNSLAQCCQRGKTPPFSRVRKESEQAEGSMWSEDLGLRTYKHIYQVQACFPWPCTLLIHGPTWDWRTDSFCFLLAFSSRHRFRESDTLGSAEQLSLVHLLSKY